MLNKSESREKKKKEKMQSSHAF